MFFNIFHLTRDNGREWLLETGSENLEKVSFCHAKNLQILPQMQEFARNSKGINRLVGNSIGGISTKNVWIKRAKKILGEDDERIISIDTHIFKFFLDEKAFLMREFTADYILS